MGAGAAGAGPPFGGAAGRVGFARSNTVEPRPELRVANIAKLNEVIMNNAAATVVALVSNVAEPRGPKAVCEPIPPNAPAKSAALPLCNSTTIIRNKHTNTCTIVSKMVISVLLRRTD